MKILVVFTGGTIGSTENKGIIIPNSESKRALIKNYNNKDGIIFEETEPYFSLSENSTGENLTKLVNCVYDNIDAYDGIIIAHGTDTLQYSGCALSFSLGSDTVPVVLVSANYPLSDKRSNGNDNFKAAVEFIKSKSGKGVFICYKNSNGITYIHRASRAMAHYEYSDDLYSIKSQYYGIMESGNFIKNNKYREKKDKIKPFKKINLNKHSEIKTIYSAVGEGFEHDSNNIYLVKAYHSGTLPTADKSFIDFAKSDNQIFISGFDKGSVYESAVIYDDLGLNILPVSTFISSYIKLWLAKSKGLPLNEIMQKSLGEDIVPAE